MKPRPQLRVERVRRTPKLGRWPLRYALLALMLAVGLLLALAVAYLVRGSLEEFPTAEQQDKVRTVARAFVLVLAAVEIVLWRVVRRWARRAV